MAKTRKNTTPGGRVEHVISGQSQSFTSLAQLLLFMAQTLEQDGRNTVC